MTKHRLIQCSPTALLDTAYLGHTLRDGRPFDTIRHWRRPAESERGHAFHWYDRIPGVGEIGCCLYVDQGAKGSLAHLTATASRRGVLPQPLVRLAVSSWCHRKLVGLARIAEATTDLGLTRS